MKRSLICAMAITALLAPAFAASFDAQTFGAALNGWRDNDTAVYELSHASYETHKPVVTTGPGGSMFLSCRVDLMAHADKGAVCILSLNFSSDGVLQSAQIKGRVNGNPIDTAMVRRGDFTPVTVPDEAAEEEIADAKASEENEQKAEKPKTATKKLNPTEELVVEVIRRFDLEMRKMAKSQPPVRRDLLSRLSKQQVETADLSGALRHNINLILQQVRAR